MDYSTTSRRASSVPTSLPSNLLRATTDDTDDVAIPSTAPASPTPHTSAEEVDSIPSNSVTTASPEPHVLATSNPLLPTDKMDDSTLPTLFSPPIFCCRTGALIHLVDNTPDELAQLECFLSYVQGSSPTVSLSLDPHIMTVRQMPLHKEPDCEGMYGGMVRFLGLKGNEEEGSLRYTEIYPTKQLLRAFRQTGVVGLKCEGHGGWFEIAVLRSDGRVHREIEGGTEVMEEKDDNGVEKEDGDAETDEHQDDADTTKLSSEAADPVDEKATATVATIVPAATTDTTPPAPTTTTSASSTTSGPSSTSTASTAPKLTETQRKNLKRRANEEAKKKDNERRKTQRKNAAAASRAAKGEVADLFVQDNQADDEDGEDEADGEEEVAEKAGAWWFCAVM